MVARQCPGEFPDQPIACPRRRRGRHPVADRFRLLPEAVAPLGPDDRCVDRILAGVRARRGDDPGDWTSLGGVPGRCTRTAGSLVLWFGPSCPERAWRSCCKFPGPAAHSTAISPPAGRPLLSAQLDVILHAPKLQRLEAAWRGVTYLIDTAAQSGQIKVRILDISWPEVVPDIEAGDPSSTRASCSSKVYEAGTGMPGGEPFGVLVGAYRAGRTGPAGTGRPTMSPG